MFLSCLFFLSSSLAQVDYFEMGRKCAEEIQSKSVLEERRSQLKQKLADVRSTHTETVNEVLKTEQEQCVRSSGSIEPKTSLYVFVSFSLPIETWKALSTDTIQAGGVLVLRGLPGDSFKLLAEKLHTLRKLGVQATIQIDPRLFKRFAVESVPCFVATKENGFDKVTGNVSLKFALEKMGIDKNVRKIL